MSATDQLRATGQSIWLDNITRELLSAGTLKRYADELNVTGLTSNPTIFERAIMHTGLYDDAIVEKGRTVASPEALFFELAIEDLVPAADIFRPTFERTGGADGWVSLEVSPLLADDADATAEVAARLHATADVPNLFVKIPGTPAGLGAIEETIFAGVPVNVTLLFSAEQYLGAAEAYARGIERRIAAGLDPRVGSVASVFVSRWDRAVADRVPVDLRNQLGVATAAQTYLLYREALGGVRWQALEAEGARPQRLLWASTGMKDPAATDTYYVEALAAPDTIDTMPEETLLAFAEHGHVSAVLDPDAREVDERLADFARAGVDVAALARDLQREGAQAFVRSWENLIDGIALKSAALERAS